MCNIDLLLIQRGEAGSSHQDDQVRLLTLPQVDLAAVVYIRQPDSFIERHKLPVIDVAASLREEAFRLSPGGAESDLMEQFEGRHSGCQ